MRLSAWLDGSKGDEDSRAELRQKEFVPELHVLSQSNA